MAQGANDQFDSFNGGADIDTFRALGAVTLNGFDTTAGNQIEVWSGQTPQSVKGTNFGETFDLAVYGAGAGMLQSRSRRSPLRSEATGW